MGRQALLEVFAVPTGQVGIALAGALIYVRAHAARELIFKVKLKKYPPSAKRFAAFGGRVVRTIVADELRFYLETRIVGANDGCAMRPSKTLRSAAVFHCRRAIRSNSPR